MNDKLMDDKDPYVITIDGPGGSGKGSLALHIAKTMGFHLLDSGAIYRLLALKALRQGVDLDNEDALMCFRGRVEPSQGVGGHADRRVETECDHRIRKIVVDRLGYSYNRNPLFRKPVRDPKRPVTAGAAA